MLDVKNISTGYGKRQVLFDISFEVKQGEIVLLIGSNGSGKSTLLKAIYGLLPVWNNGSVYFNGENITGVSTSALLKKGLLYIPQKDNLFENLTVQENLEMAGLILNDNKIVKQRIEMTLAVFSSLKPHLKKIPMKLSGGERKLLTLAMATLHEPKLIMIDEPFAGLSQHNITFIGEILKQLNENLQISFLIVEHRIKESFEIANKFVSLKLGRIFKEIMINKEFAVAELDSVFV